MKIIFLIILAILAFPAQTTPSMGQYKKCYMVRIETTNTGCILTDVWYPCFVGKGEIK